MKQWFKYKQGCNKFIGFLTLWESSHVQQVEWGQVSSVWKPMAVCNNNNNNKVVSYNHHHYLI